MKRTDEENAAQPDPIVDSSLSWPMAITALLLVLSTVWAAYDEFVTRRPWKRYQAAFVPAYDQLLNDVKARQQKKEKEIRKEPEYRQLADEFQSLVDEAKPRRTELAEELRSVSARMEAILETLKEARSYSMAAIYKIETASESAKDKRRASLEKYHQGPFQVNLPGGEDGATLTDYNYQQLLAAFAAIQEEKSELRRELGDLVQREARKSKAMTAYMTKQLDGPPSEMIEMQIAALKESFRYDITSHQIHVEEVGLVDRCEVCHLAIRSPVAVTAEQIRQTSGGISEDMAKAFTSHPRVELPDGDLLQVHRVDQFGCTPCHGGNGRALSFVDHAHGHNKHWLWPLLDKENTEAGCVQCHQDAMFLPGAETLNRGRYLFLRLGCWGCHPRDGFDAEALALKNTAQQERSIDNQRLRLNRLDRDLDAVYEDEDVEFDPQALQQQRAALQQQLSQLDTDADQVAFRKASLLRARKNPGPGLTEVRAKLRQEWIPTWLRDPAAFRPTTRMPRFNLSDDQVRKVSAFLWQAAQDREVPHYEPGDAERGKDLFESRGCQACHRLDGQAGFASNLARLNEKANYDYLVEWILHPLEGAIMPDLRLEEQGARDVTSYLMDQPTESEYEPVDYLTDQTLFDEGKDLVKHFGCFGCHEIAGMENFSRVGVDLTKEGSKPIERLDFGLLTHEAEQEHWYTHKGFFDHKLSNPPVFDEGKLKLDWHENLKMPDFGLGDRPQDRRALITFLLGSVDSRLPDFFYHDPTGASEDVQAGWWVARKYNCTGCHQLTPGETPAIWELPQYQGEKGLGAAPPSLVGAGARLDADWLIKFLRNPALSETELHRNGARMYLDVRMPTYKVSEEEIGKLVRFLNALSKQPSPYPFEKLSPLNADELADARAIFEKSRCLSCHVASDDPSTYTSETKAPSYVISAERLKPRWMRHWMLDPGKIMPGTVMPADLFKQVDGRWVARFLPQEPLRVEDADHLELIVRYQKFFDEEEAQYWLRTTESEEGEEE